MLTSEMNWRPRQNELTVTTDKKIILDVVGNKKHQYFYQKRWLVFWPVSFFSWKLILIWIKLFFSYSTEWYRIIIWSTFHGLRLKLMLTFCWLITFVIQKFQKNNEEQKWTFIGLRLDSIQVIYLCSHLSILRCKTTRFTFDKYFWQKRDGKMKGPWETGMTDRFSPLFIFLRERIIFWC